MLHRGQRQELEDEAILAVAVIGVTTSAWAQEKQVREISSHRDRQGRRFKGASNEGKEANRWAPTPPIGLRVRGGDPLPDATYWVKG